MLLVKFCTFSVLERLENKDLSRSTCSFLRPFGWLLVNPGAETPLVKNEQKIPSEVHTFPSGTKDTRLSRYVGKEATTTLLGDVRFWPYGPKPNIT